MGKHSTKQAVKPKRGKRVAIAVLVIVLIILIACGVIVVVRPPFAQVTLDRLGVPNVLETISPTSSALNQSQSSSSSSNEFSTIADAQPTDEELEAEKQEWKEAHQTPLIAQCSGIDLHCSIAPADLTGILFHQASYEYGLPLSTEVPEADYDTVADTRSMRINHNQQTGEWLDAEALHLWRTSDDTDMDTCIDIGALPGSIVYAPVDGTVVLISDYMLYDEMPDIEIHIQPDGRPDLDCVLIHTTDPTVKVGDHVEAGITPVSHIRDIESYLDDVQLGFFVPEEVGGNHVHVQVNDANFEGYREKKLAGAISVKQ